MSETTRAFVDRFSDETFGGEDGLLVMDGFDDCIIGVGQRFTDYFVIYDFKKVIEKLMAEGMTYEEAVEFHEYNQVGAWVGPKTPVFMHLPEEE
jgi:hypothetical protein